VTDDETEGRDREIICSYILSTEQVASTHDRTSVSV